VRMSTGRQGDTGGIEPRTLLVRCDLHGNVCVCVCVCVVEEELTGGGEDDDDDDDSQSGASAEAGCDVIESGDVGVLFLERARLTSDPGEHGRTDFTNFRGLLWRAMTHFPECVEARSRDLSPLILRFIRCGR